MNENTELLPFHVYSVNNRSESIQIEALDWSEALEIGRALLEIEQVGVEFAGAR